MFLTSIYLGQPSGLTRKKGLRGSLPKDFEGSAKQKKKKTFFLMGLPWLYPLPPQKTTKTKEKKDRDLPRFTSVSPFWTSL